MYEYTDTAPPLPSIQLIRSIQLQCSIQSSINLVSAEWCSYSFILFYTAQCTTPSSIHSSIIPSTAPSFYLQPHNSIHSHIIPSTAQIIPSTAQIIPSTAQFFYLHILNIILKILYSSINSIFYWKKWVFLCCGLEHCSVVADYSQLQPTTTPQLLCREGLDCCTAAYFKVSMRAEQSMHITVKLQDLENLYDKTPKSGLRTHFTSCIFM